MTGPESLGLAAAFIAGTAGSAHCFGMCGGMAGALGMRARAQAGSAAHAFWNALLYHCGRLAGYALGGLLLGAAGSSVGALIDLGRFATWIRVASGVLLVLVAVRILSGRNPLAFLERLGARFWHSLRPLSQRAASSNHPAAAVLVGLLWGWLPCGLVYSMLTFAALSGDAAQGGAIMLAFGAGTLPAMLTSTLLASQLQRVLARRWPRYVSGTLLAAFGFWTMAVPLVHLRHAMLLH